MHYSSLRSKILIIKGNIWTNRPVRGLLACYNRCYRILFFTMFSSRNGPSRRLNNTNNNRNTSALMQERAKTPPSNVNPPSLLIWAEGNHILRPREPPDHPSPSHYTLASHAGLFRGARMEEIRAPLKTPAWEANYTPRFPCFLSVSSSASFPKYVPWFWWPLP